MNKFFRLSTSLLIFLQGLILVLVLFTDKIHIPFAFLGRLHPLVLHLPIGFGVFLVLIFVLKKWIDGQAFQEIFRFLLYLTSIFSAITAIFGMFLSSEGGYEVEQITFHQWAGLGVNWLYVLLIIAYEKGYLEGRNLFYGVTVGLASFLLAGHGGADLTHGEGYLWPEKDGGIVVLTEESVVFEAVIQPIFKQKCESCHNNQKTKGALNMSSVAKLLKGGKNGAIWKAGDPLNSHFIQRAKLPIDDKKHMPPKGKAQLSPDEVLILTAWVQEGASVSKKLGAFGANSKLVSLAKKLQNTAQALLIPVKEYDFSAASESNLAAANTPFCSVYPLSSDAPALQADFYVSKKYERKTLENLSKVSDQLVGLNLSKMPLKDEEISLITKFANLEKLILNFTEITGKTLGELSACKHLTSLAVSGTKVNKEVLVNLLGKIPTLKEVFIWNTGVGLDQVAGIQAQFPKVKIQAGYVPKDEKLQINPPILVTENFILRPNEDFVFKHTLKDVTFHYTLNDSTPDSLGALVSRGPLKIEKYSKVKVMATKPGWLASRVLEYKVYKSSFIPDSIYLLSKPDVKYPAKGGYSLKDFVQGARETGRRSELPDYTWLGFFNSDLEALFEFKKPISPKGITFSYLRKTDSDVFPPVSIEVLAGNSPNALTRVALVKPEKPEKRNGHTQMGQDIPLKPGNYTYYKIKALSLRHLPKYLLKDDKKEEVVNKGKPAWLRVDEILFY